MRWTAFLLLVVTAAIFLGIVLSLSACAGRQKREAKNAGRESEALTQALMDAVEKGDLSAVKESLSRGADVNARDGQRMTALHHAAENGHKAIVEILIESGAEVNATVVEGENYEWKTPFDLTEEQDHKDVVELLEKHGGRSGELEMLLWDAVMSDEDEIEDGIEQIKELLAKGVSIDARDCFGRTPLRYRTEAYGCDTVSKLLIAEGADVNAKDYQGKTPLHEVAQGWAEEPRKAIELLADAGADVNAVDNRYFTPLDCAVENHQQEVVALLRERGGKSGEPHRASLMQAAQKGNVARTKKLLVKGANINARDEQGWTPLDWAVTEGHWELANMLVAAGGIVGPGELETRTALHNAAAVGNKEAAEFLVAKGADVEARDGGYDLTPLHVAASCGHKEIAALLIASGADVNAMSGESITFPPRTALHEAASEGYKDVVILLLASGADINLESTGWRGLGMPIHWAASESRKEIVELLIARGARVDTRDNQGHTPLHWAASHGRKEMVELLVSRGAVVEVKNEEGKTPLEYAVKEGHDDVAEILRKHGAVPEKEERK